MSFILFPSGMERRNKKQMKDDIKRPWEAMYRALLKRLTAFVYPEDPETIDISLRFSLKEIVDIHNKLLEEHDDDGYTGTKK
tara:strand:- start:671 stop:916 length:246 start_codon:yes stop_codon:yes gene_type:complete